MSERAFLQLTLLGPGVYRENTVCTDEILITAVVSSDGCKGDTCLRCVQSVYKGRTTVETNSRTEFRPVLSLCFI